MLAYFPRSALLQTIARKIFSLVDFCGPYMVHPAMADMGKYKLSTRIGVQNKYRSLRSMQKTAALQNHPYFGLARISVRPPRKLCDLTGLPAPYTCPRTSLRYYNVSVYKYLEGLGSEHVEKYYEIKMYGKNMMNMKR